MQIFDTLKQTKYYTSVALGFFDGVHLGHQDVINTAVNASSDLCKATVLTFKDSPTFVLSGNKKTLLTTNEEKFELFEKLGVEYVFCIDFKEVCSMTAEDFVREVLYNTLNAKFVIAGFNYHFGKGGTADADDMLTMCHKLKIDSCKRMPVKYKNEPVSSTRIRKCILNGEIEDANAMLSYNFSITSKVTSGNHIGTTLSTPTINQPLKNEIVTPKFGVYASSVTIGDKVFLGATNVGTHPTVGESEPLCETHLLNFDSGDLYGQKVKTELLHFIRPEKKFESLEKLKIQIQKDKNDIIASLLK
ncbi:MAG: bifunctional riboflavin kinase/FAD synthetase [Ruminococcus sp.]|nr:bifunctional riboflavin kinase/FAD synthetase [Ruminococcus sp.]